MIEPTQYKTPSSGPFVHFTATMASPVRRIKRQASNAELTATLNEEFGFLFENDDDDAHKQKKQRNDAAAAADSSSSSSTPMDVRMMVTSAGRPISLPERDDDFWRSIEAQCKAIRPFMHPQQPRAFDVKLLRSNTRYAWSPKLDGHRAIWDGFNQRLISKGESLVVHPPVRWSKHLPSNMVLDGELIYPGEGDNKYKTHPSQVNGVWTSLPNSSLWDHLQFHCFDLWSNEIAKKFLWVRLCYLQGLFRRRPVIQQPGRGNPFFRAVLHTEIEAAKEGADLAVRIETLADNLRNGDDTKGIEGMVIKNTDSVYSGQESLDWMKYKFKETMEGKVISVSPKENPRKYVYVELVDGSKMVVYVSRANLIKDDRLPRGTLVDLEFLKETTSGNKREAVIVNIIDTRRESKKGTTEKQIWEKYQLQYRENQRIKQQSESFLTSPLRIQREPVPPPAAAASSAAVPAPAPEQQEVFNEFLPSYEFTQQPEPLPSVDVDAPVTLSPGFEYADME